LSGLTGNSKWFKFLFANEIKIGFEIKEKKI